MEQTRKNKEFIVNYINAISTANTKSRSLLEQYISDEGLIGHIMFFETAFPRYEIMVDELTAEDNRVIIKGRFKGTHQGDLSGIAPTYKTVDFPIVVGYHIQNNKIVSHWMLADQTSMLEQLGVVPSTEVAH